MLIEETRSLKENGSATDGNSNNIYNNVQVNQDYMNAFLMQQ